MSDEQVTLASLAGWDNQNQSSFHEAKEDLREVAMRKADIQHGEWHQEKLQVWGESTSKNHQPNFMA